MTGIEHVFQFDGIPAPPGSQADCDCGCGRRMVVTRDAIGRRFTFPVEPGESVEQALTRWQPPSSAEDDFAGQLDRLIADGATITPGPPAEPLTVESLQAAFDQIARDYEHYEPRPIILPPPPDWMAEHDDGEPRIVLCQPDRAVWLRSAIEMYGREAWYVVVEDRDGVLPEGQTFVMAPGRIKLGPPRQQLFGEPTPTVGGGRRRRYRVRFIDAEAAATPAARRLVPVIMRALGRHIPAMRHRDLIGRAALPGWVVIAVGRPRWWEA